MTPCKELDEVRNKALGLIKIEEDKKIEKNTHNPYDYTNKKIESFSQKSCRPEPYSRTMNHRFNAHDYDKENENYPEISDYYFLLMLHVYSMRCRILRTRQDGPRKMRRPHDGKTNLSDVLTMKTSYTTPKIDVLFKRRLAIY